MPNKTTEDFRKEVVEISERIQQLTEDYYLSDRDQDVLKKTKKDLEKHLSGIPYTDYQESRVMRGTKVISVEQDSRNPRLERVYYEYYDANGKKTGGPWSLSLYDQKDKDQFARLNIRIGKLYNITTVKTPTGWKWISATEVRKEEPRETQTHSYLLELA